MATNQRFAGDAWHDKEVRRRTRLALGLAGRQRMTPAQQAQFKEEFQRQTKLFRQEREQNKVERRLTHQEASQAAAQLQQTRMTNDAIWGKAHQEDTDSQLLEYVRQQAQALGRTPKVSEVEGGYYILGRFGSWPVVLHYADLPFPPGLKRPKPTALNAYLKRRQAALTAPEKS